MFCAALQGGGVQPLGAVERTVLFRVQDVRQRQHRRARARLAARLRAQGVQGYVTSRHPFTYSYCIV